VALVLISFLPLVEILHYPVVGLASLAVALTTLVARVRFPGRLPGALGVLLVGGTIFYLMKAMSLLDEPPAQTTFSAAESLWPTEWLSVFQFEWIGVLRDSFVYLPVVIPFALTTVIGGIDCTESAAAAGDDYPTGVVIAVEAFATLVAGMCGGVIQTTPYIGHPAYKAMGGRAAYALATALFIGSAGLVGYFGYLYLVIPKAAVFPILVFIGLEITAQSFHATPVRHYAAVAIACVPALAALVWIYVEKLHGEMALHGITFEQLSEPLHAELETIRVMSNGFVVTSLIWASALAAIIDRRMTAAAITLLTAAVFSTFGVIHSPLPGAAMFLPWHLPPSQMRVTIGFGSGYLVAALLLWCWGKWIANVMELPRSGDDHERCLTAGAGNGGDGRRGGSGRV
jgi:AGZA family xanthine/uracil permease-like MFS transporter